MVTACDPAVTEPMGAAKLSALAVSEMVPGGVAVALKVTGARPATVAVSVLAPTAPSVHAPTVAIPAALVVCVAPARVPPPEAIAKVTETPADGWPMPLRMTTDGATATATPVAVDWLLPALIAMEPMSVGTAVAEKATAERPDTVAVSVLAPTAVPRTQDPAVATPAAFVVADAPDTLPIPPATAKVTGTPDTTLPAESRTVTDGATATAVPTVALWLSPAVLFSDTGLPAMTVMVPVADAPDVDLAVMMAVPIVRARRSPVLVTLTTAGLSEVNVMVWPVTGSPSSVAVTEIWTVAPTFSTADVGFRVTDTTPLGAVTESLPQRTKVNINVAASSTNRAGKDFIIDRVEGLVGDCGVYARADYCHSKTALQRRGGARSESLRKHLVRPRQLYGLRTCCTTHESGSSRGNS